MESAQKLCHAEVRGNGTLYTASRTKCSAGGALRESIVDRVATLLEVVNDISDSSLRLPIQASCLDLIVSLEEVIGTFELDTEHTTDNGS